MKVLFYDTTQAYLTPGGKTVHAIKLRKELQALGINVEFANWWDESQNDFDIIHFFSASNSAMINNVKKKNKKALLTHILDFETNKSSFEKKKSKIIIRLIKMLPRSFQSKFDWNNLILFDRIVYMHKYDKATAIDYFPHLDESKLSIIPHAYDPSDIGIGENIRLDNKLPKKYLISCGTICIRKQSVLLAQFAKEAKVPIVFIGSYNSSDPYFQSFINLVDNKFVFYPGYVSREVKDSLESNASGFVLLSQGESGCIAVYEAAAYNLPILLSNLPWAWGYDSPTNINYCNYQNREVAIQELKTFYEKSSKLEHPPFRIHSWNEIAKMYKKHYESLLGS